MKKPSGILAFFLITATVLSAQSGNTQAGIDFTFDFSAVSGDSIQAAVLLYRDELILIDAGKTKTLRVPYQEVYYFGYRYGNRNMTAASSGQYVTYDLPLYLSRTTSAWTIAIPPPPRNPSGLTRLRLRNDFNNHDSVRIRVQDENGKSGAIGNAVFSRNEAGNPINADSVLNRAQEREFILEAGKYAIEIIDNNDTVVRKYDSFNFPAAFGPYMITLGEDKIRPAASIGLLPGQDLGKSVALDQEFEISFSRAMIEALVEADLHFYANDDPEKKNISLTAEWKEQGRKLTLRPRNGWLLSPDTEYVIALGLNCRDLYGNALERYTERVFRTTSVYQGIATAPVMETPYKEFGVLKTFRLEWKPIHGADGYELRFFYGGGLSEIKKVLLDRSLQYEVDRTEFRQNDFIEYLFLPYKKIGGKTAYSATAMQAPRKRLYFTDQTNTGRTAAQNIDALVKKAVDELVAWRNTPISVNIKTPTIGSTDSVSAFSGYLGKIIERNATNNTLYQVTPQARGAPPVRKAGEQRGQIAGSYDLVGDQVEVTLTLITDPDGRSIKATNFNISNAELERLSLSVLPENRKTKTEVQTQAALFENIPLSPPSAPVAPSPRAITPASAPHTGATVSAQSELAVQIWPNKESRTYFDGDTMTISLYASQDCWFKVYHIDVNNQMRLIYPNQTDRNNTLRANTERVIPDNTFFTLGAPYGEETILAVFSGTPFENLEKDMLYPEPATRESINRAAGWRGLAVKNTAANTPDSPEKTTAARFSYTILPADFIEDTFSFKRPSD